MGLQIIPLLNPPAAQTARIARCAGRMENAVDGQVRDFRK
jgi:hypothetical protein